MTTEWKLLDARHSVRWAHCDIHNGSCRRDSYVAMLLQIRVENGVKTIMREIRICRPCARSILGAAKKVGA